jgi:hypothetical protein
MTLPRGLFLVAAVDRWSGLLDLACPAGMRLYGGDVVLRWPERLARLGLFRGVLLGIYLDARSHHLARLWITRVHSLCTTYTLSRINALRKPALRRLPSPRPNESAAASSRTSHPATSWPRFSRHACHRCSTNLPRGPEPRRGPRAKTSAPRHRHRVPWPADKRRRQRRGGSGPKSKCAVVVISK